MDFSISVVIPAYNRVAELDALLASIEAQTEAPDEVVVVEDCSPQRDALRDLCTQWQPRLDARAIKLRFVENSTNLGFDANVRKCLDLSSSRWSLLMGNDDLLLPLAVATIRQYVDKYPVAMVSRSFLRFDTDIRTPLGVSSLASGDRIFAPGNSGANQIFRCAAFIGGLLFDTAFCHRLRTEKYDGSLYYQIHLAAAAYCGTGIGYIATPIVGGRANNPPMFGNNPNERSVHIPGGYTAQGRAKMWEGVLRIAGDASSKYHVDLLSPIRRELMVRQAFHIFEMNAAASHKTLHELKTALAQLGLFAHPFPRLLYAINYLFGVRSRLFYDLVRRALQ